jgi:hypothetical protein
MPGTPRDARIRIARSRSAVMLGTAFGTGAGLCRGPRDFPVGLPVRTAVDAGRGELVGSRDLALDIAGEKGVAMSGGSPAVRRWRSG